MHDPPLMLQVGLWHRVRVVAEKFVDFIQILRVVLLEKRLIRVRVTVTVTVTFTVRARVRVSRLGLSLALDLGLDLALGLV